MTNAKHTLGLWAIGSEIGREPLVVYSKAGDNKYFPVAKTTPCRFAPDEEEYNARLIAAAPKLLGALEYAKDLLEALPVRGEVVADCLADINATLAKARGTSDV